MVKVPKISEAEWRVMKILWGKAPLTAGQVIESLEEDTEWKPKTIKTLIDRLVQKGALTFEKKGRVHLYSPTVEEEACLEAESASFLERFFGGSLNPMLARLVESGKLPREEIQELRVILKKGEDNDES